MVQVQTNDAPRLKFDGGVDVPSSDALPGDAASWIGPSMNESIIDSVLDRWSNGEHDEHKASNPPHSEPGADA
jgi:hypothetical protein